MSILPHRAPSVFAVPAFKDNYLWLVHDGVHATVIDPGAAGPVLEALSAHHLTLGSILLTHHHADHIGGVPQLLRSHKVPVYGPPDERIDCITHTVDEGNQIHIAELKLDFSVLATPGHTRSHITYHAVVF